MQIPQPGLTLKINFSLCYAQSIADNHVFVFSVADHCTKTIRSQVSQCIFSDIIVWIYFLVAIENWLPKTDVVIVSVEMQV